MRVYDPWLPPGLLREHDCEAASLAEALRASKLLFILAGVTAETRRFLGRRELETIAEDTAVVLASRAAVVDFDAFVLLAQAGRFCAAIDVFPREPVEDHPVRGWDRILLSPHRAGGMRESYAKISEMITENLELMLEGLPPVRLQRAEARTAAAGRSR